MRAQLRVRLRGPGASPASSAPRSCGASRARASARRSSTSRPTTRRPTGMRCQRRGRRAHAARDLPAGVRARGHRAPQPWTVMCAYNRINGTYASEHPWLLTAVLRDEWGFEGLVVSDWGAVHDRVPALAAGLDLQMPSAGARHRRRRSSPRSATGRSTRRCSTSPSGACCGSSQRACPARRQPAAVDVDAHHALAREAAAAGRRAAEERRRAAPAGRRPTASP